jgi:hypothetical protein
MAEPQWEIASHAPSMSDAFFSVRRLRAHNRLSVAATSIDVLLRTFAAVCE